MQKLANVSENIHFPFSENCYIRLRIGFENIDVKMETWELKILAKS